MRREVQNMRYRMNWIRTSAAPVDESRTLIQGWLDEGFTHAIWEVSFDPCDICLALGGQEMDLQEMLDTAEHDAPMYTQTHCGCRCLLVDPFTK